MDEDAIPQPIFKAPDLTPETPSQPPSEPSHSPRFNLLFFVAAIGLLAVGLGGGYYYGKNASSLTPSIVVSPTKQVPTLTSIPPTKIVTEASASSGIESMTTCSNADIKVQINVPQEFVCESKPHMLFLSSTDFDITISDFGRGGPCPIYNGEPETDAQPHCTKTEFYSNSFIKVDKYEENDKIIALFGSVGETTPEKALTYIDIVHKSNPGMEPDGTAKNALMLLLEAIQPL